jgi:hypothetical protein
MFMQHARIEEAWAKYKAKVVESIVLRQKGDKLGTKGLRCYAEGEELKINGKFTAEGERLMAQGMMVFNEGEILDREGCLARAEGEHIYCLAVTKAHGDNAIIDWDIGAIEAGENQI